MDTKSALQLTGQICEQVRNAQQNIANYSLIYENPNQVTKKNDFILFIKPELTLKNDNIKLQEIVNHIFSKIAAFGFEINLIKVLGGSYLEENNIMAKHYGVINKISNDARNAVSEQAQEKFKEIYGIDFSSANVYGGHEFKKRFPELTALSLAMLWQNSNFQKITSGTYCGKIKFDEQPYYLVNGFHPRQLEHFNAPGRSIVVFSLSADISWPEARNNFIGVTDPSKAMEGSLRNEFLKMKEELGIPVFNGAFNGVHLSAGPVEALNELIRFNSDYTSKDGIKTLTGFRAGQLLAQHFNNEGVQKILENEKIVKNGHAVASFDLTEEKDTDEMISILSPYYS